MATTLQVEQYFVISLFSLSPSVAMHKSVNSYSYILCLKVCATAFGAWTWAVEVGYCLCTSYLWLCIVTYSYVVKSGTIKVGVCTHHPFQMYDAFGC